MKKGLKIDNNFYLNMDAIITWRVSSEGISIMTSAKTENNHFLISTKEPELGTFPVYFIVSLQEMKRIIKEISEYMGVA